MKKFLSLLLLIALILTGCGKEEEPAPQKDWQPENSSSPEAEIDETWHPCTVRSFDPDTVNYPSFYWDPDNNLVVQNETAVISISPENKLINEISLNVEQQPNCDQDPFLVECGRYILALHRNKDYRVNSCVYYTYNGGLYLSGTSVYTREGEFLYEFPGANFVWDNGKNDLPAPENDFVMKSTPSERYSFYPFGDTKAFVCLYNAVGIFDFENQTGEIIWKGDEEGKNFGTDELGMGSPFYFNGKLWFTSFYYKGEKEVQHIWTVGENGAELFGEGRIIYGEGAYLVFIRDESIYCINLEGEVTKMGTDGNFLSNVSVNGDRISFQKNSEAGEEIVFYSYNAVTKRAETHFSGFNAGAHLLGSRINSGKPDYYYIISNGDEGTLWKYDGEKGYNEKIKENVNVVVGNPLNSSCELMGEFKQENGEFFVRVVRVDTPPKHETEQTPYDPEGTGYLLEEREFFEIYRPGGDFENYKSEHTEDFNRAYKFASSCFALPVQELDRKIESGEIEGESFYGEEGKTAVYALCDSEDYGLMTYYIWVNLETNERELIYAEGFLNEVFEPNMLMLHTHGKLTVFDITTGKLSENAPKFDFGYYSEQGFQYALMGLCYDKTNEKYVAAYYENLLADKENYVAELKLAVFDKTGEHIKNISTGNQVSISSRYMWLYAKNSYCAYPGVVSFSFYSNESQEVEEIIINYETAEPEGEKTGIYALWDKFAGSWYNREKLCDANFFIRNGEYYFTLSGAERVTAKAKEFEIINESDNCYKITAEKENGEEVILFVYTEKPGDNKMRIFLQNKDPLEYEFAS